MELDSPYARERSINCDRSSGRSRIGTDRHEGSRVRVDDCDRSSGRSRIGTLLRLVGREWVPIAIVLRGDRGLEPESLHSPPIPIHCDRSSGRSRIGTAPSLLCNGYGLLIAIVLRGDRGLELSIFKFNLIPESIAIVLRGDRGLEPEYIRDANKAGKLRSFFGAIEDWNW